MFLKIFTKPEKLTYLIIIVAIFGAIFSLQKEHYNRYRTETRAQQDAKQIESAQTALKAQKLIPAFGLSNLRADLAYLQFVQYFGDEKARNQTGYNLVPRYFETVASYDPNFTQASLSLSVANSMYAGQAEKTVLLMEKILASSAADLDDAYSIWFAKGLDEFLFLGDNQAALNSHQNAAKSAIYQKQNDLATITKVNQRKIKYLATDPDTTKAQIFAWKSVLPHVVDPDNRQRISDRIAFLEQNLSYQVNK